jgi:hypothetical protein
MSREREVLQAAVAALNRGDFVLAKTQTIRRPSPSPTCGSSAAAASTSEMSPGL